MLQKIYLALSTLYRRFIDALSTPYTLRCYFLSNVYSVFFNRFFLCIELWALNEEMGNRFSVKTYKGVGECMEVHILGSTDRYFVYFHTGMSINITVTSLLHIIPLAGRSTSCVAPPASSFLERRRFSAALEPRLAPLPYPRHQRRTCRRVEPKKKVDRRRDNLMAPDQGCKAGEEDFQAKAVTLFQKMQPVHGDVL